MSTPCISEPSTITRTTLSVPASPTSRLTSLLSPVVGRKHRGEHDNSGRSGLQSPLLGKKESPGLPGGDITTASSSVQIMKEGSPRFKKSSKWRLKLKASEDRGGGGGGEETASTSSLESEKRVEVSRVENKRKKMESKQHNRAGSFDYRLLKDIFKISLPRSRSAGELEKDEERSIPEEGGEKTGKKGISLRLRPSFKGSKGSCQTVGNGVDRDENGALTQGDGLVGLKNLGNTCFMNSIIQCLSHSRVVREYFLSRKYKADLSGSSKMQGRLAEEFANLLTDMWSGKSDVVSPNKFKAAVAKSAPRFVGYSQQDSQEFLRFFMEGLHEDLNRGKKGKRKIEDPPKGLTDTQLAEHRWQDYLTYDNSSIVNIFVGLLKSTLTCSACNHKSVTFDPFWDLSLPLPRSKGNCPSLQSCFAEFTQEEILDGEEKPTCESCKKRQKCTKQFSIERFPPILVLHLKRFSEVRYRTKLSTKVDFPVDNLDLSDFASSTEQEAPRYDLVGVSNHSGNTFSGHYIAYCRTTGRWHRFSDSSVSGLSRSDIVSPEAYVLFYERRS